MDQHEERRAAAIASITAKRSFRNHAFVYCAVNTLLVVIWAASGAGYFWPVWPMLGWGIGVVAHAVSVYAVRSKISEERIDHEMQGRFGS